MLGGTMCGCDWLSCCWCRRTAPIAEPAAAVPPAPRTAFGWGAGRLLCRRGAVGGIWWPVVWRNHGSPAVLPVDEPAATVTEGCEKPRWCPTTVVCPFWVAVAWLFIVGGSSLGGRAAGRVCFRTGPCLISTVMRSPSPDAFLASGCCCFSFSLGFLSSLGRASSSDIYSVSFFFTVILECCYFSSSCCFCCLTFQSDAVPCSAAAAASASSDASADVAAGASSLQQPHAHVI